MDLNDNVIDANKIKSLKEFKSIFKSVAILIGVFLLLIIAYNLLTFRVYETKQAVVSRFGQVTKIVVAKKTPELIKQIQSDSRVNNVQIVEGKGLHFKVPFIDHINYYSDMLLTYDSDPREVTTSDKKKLIFDNYAQWRISNVALFSISMKNEVNAHTRLDDIIYSTLNQYIGQTNGQDLISNLKDNQKMLDKVLVETNNQLKGYGMNVLDIKIKRTDLPEDNKKNVYKRMISEREQQATKFRSEGKMEAIKIESTAKKQATIIRADAYQQSQQIKGEGDAKALKIYADAFNQDPQFYQFYRTLEAYKKTIDGKTKIVIPADSEFAKFLFNPNPK